MVKRLKNMKWVPPASQGSYADLNRLVCNLRISLYKLLNKEYNIWTTPTNYPDSLYE